MSEQPGKGTGPAFPELELDMPARPKPGTAIDEEEEEDGPGELSIELDAPVSLRKAPEAPPSGPVSARGGVQMGPPMSARVPMGPPVSPSGAPPASSPAAVSMGPPAALAQTFASAAPPPIAVGATVPPPSGAAALVHRAREAAKGAVEDPGEVARNVAEIGNRTSTALVMLGGAIVLTLVDVVYARITGERFSLGPIRLVWLAAPLAFLGAVVIGVRLVKEHAQ